MSIRALSELWCENVDFEIHEIFPEGWRRSREFSLYKNKARPSQALFFVCTDIEVCFYPVDSAAVIAKKGDVVWIPEGCCYEVRVGGEPTMLIDTYTINFDMWNERHEPIGVTDRISVLTNRQDNLFEVHLRNLSEGFHRVAESRMRGRHNLFKTKGEFFLLLDLIAKSLEQNNDFYYPIRKGVELFCSEWNRNERIEVYAAVCGVSETYFYRCFRRWSGSSPVEYRNLLRLSNAENLLRCTNMQVQEISETVGFDDPFYFCRLFSAHFGLSPRNYRNQFQGQWE